MKQRIEELDITKAIGIIMVVVGHTQLPTFMSNFIWSFHMPLFYIISGIILSQKKYTSFKLFLTRKIRTLIIPYIIFSIIIFEGYKLLSLPINNHPIQEVISGWYGIALWFLPNLFLTELIFFYIMKLNKKLVISILCILAILGYIIGPGVVPYKLTTLCPSICFLGIGYISSTLYLQIIKNNSLIKIFIFTIITFFISVINIPRLDLAWNQIGNPILGYIGGICGTLLVLTFSKNIITLNKTIKKILLYIGSNTLIILAFHQLILASLKELSVHYIILQHSLVRFICCIIILYFIIYICNNYFYFILGKNESSSNKCSC
ncbi:acyltransferase family protein [Phocaeicola plebeius]|jgi:acyltransferase|uniref:Acyltransferase 3 domain-containing protein n=1 Tax=Phocaeicola plebeius TaxID=310297 RepID=A0A414REF9_9BACT|nr:hypothetical protein DW653_06860 [Phocaeicola plebeius]